MGKEAVASSRTEAARHVSALMLNPEFHRDLAGQDLLNENGEIPMVVAGADESAVVTLHRMERIKATRVVVVTYMDERIAVIVMKTVTASESKKELVDVVGGMTVRDWIEMMRLNPGACTYHASGSDIMSAVNASEYAIA